VPVFGAAGLAGFDAEAGQLRPLAQAAFDLGEAAEPGQRDDVVPQRDGVFLARQPADHRAEEGGALRRAELDDRRSDVPAGLIALSLFRHPMKMRGSRSSS